VLFRLQSLLPFFINQPPLSGFLFACEVILPLIIQTTYIVNFWDIHKDKPISRRLKDADEAIILMDRLRKAGHSNVRLEMKHKKKRI